MTLVIPRAPSTSGKAPSRAPLSSVALVMVLLVSIGPTTGLSTAPRRGTASKPTDKKRVAVFGAGGKLGSSIFGFLQRASSIYGTGLGGRTASSSPRAIGATASTSQSLNRYLAGRFKLAYAGEDMVRLTDMSDVDAIAARLQGMDAIVCGTVNRLERRPVTANTYERGPNDWTCDFFLDGENNVGDGDGDGNGEKRSPQTHLDLFRNTILGCKAAGVKHVVVVETPRTLSVLGGSEATALAVMLDEGGIPFTYIDAVGGGRQQQEWASCKDYTYEKGLQCRLAVRGVALPERQYGSSRLPKYPGDWISSLRDSTSGEQDGEGNGHAKDGRGTIYREDIAALAVQSLMSLDWTTSRYLKVSVAAPPASRRGAPKADDTAQGEKGRRRKVVRTDREWCVNSGVLAEALAAVK